MNGVDRSGLSTIRRLVVDWGRSYWGGYNSDVPPMDGVDRTGCVGHWTSHFMNGVDRSGGVPIRTSY